MAILVALALVANRGFRSLVRNYFELKSLKKHKIQVEKDKLNLEKELKTIKNPQYIEHTARKELGVIKPGEIEYRFPSPREEDAD